MGLFWGPFGATLGSLWIYDGDLRSLWDHCGIIVESLWVYERTFSKNTHSPTSFNDFIKSMSGFGIDLGLLWDFFWHMRVTLGSFWVTLGSLWAYRRRIAGMMCVVAGLMVSWSGPNGSAPTDLIRRGLWPPGV